MADPVTAGALELLGRVLEEARAAGLEAMVESLTWRDGRVARDTDSIVFAAAVAHDMGAPVLKVPVPDVEPGAARVDAVARVVASVGAPVLFLGGPRGRGRPRRRAGRGARRHGGRRRGPGHRPGRAAGPRPGRDGPAGCGRRALVILTVDLGTSATKVALWGATAGSGGPRWPPSTVPAGGPSRIRRGGGPRWSRRAPAVRQRRRPPPTGRSTPPGSPRPVRPSWRSPPTARRSGRPCCGRTAGRGGGDRAGGCVRGRRRGTGAHRDRPRRRRRGRQDGVAGGPPTRRRAPGALAGDAP